MLKRKPLTLAIFILSCLSLTATTSKACFSIVVGKDASADGYVIVAHNEDDGPPQLVNHHKVPRRNYAADQTLKLSKGAQIPQARQTWSYIWSEMPGMNYSDSFINEHGLTVTSDNCPSRENKPDITEGGIGKMLRHLIAQRAKTAREGVILAGQLVEQFGYIDSGRTYIIADPYEGWLFAVVNGKHWLAKRVPDDQVAMIANTYTIRNVDLADTENCLASKDIIDYAVKRGWYKPEIGPFDFAKTYANPDSAVHSYNLSRLWRGLNFVTDKPISYRIDLPFSVTPKQKIDPTILMQILRDDNDLKKMISSSPNPDQITAGLCQICSGGTQTSFVVQLRADKPLEIGILYWIALAPPRTSFYVPFYFGISDFPKGYRTDSKRPSQSLWDKKTTSAFHPNRLEAFWTFSNFLNKTENASPETIVRIQTAAKQFEQTALERQKAIETALSGNKTNNTVPMLTNYSDSLFLTTLEIMDTILSEESGV